MKCVVLACVLFALQINAQCIPNIAPVLPTTVAPAIVPAGSVANTLADTLSLLTVSSLLAEKLPLGAPVWPAPCGCGYNSCGCGYPYGSILI
ncbi:uncharacterized protein LOC121739996 [Aricia agestis]|uniref:uncharacterized protein LOC121739996 n=1 Tax=Aricia agestis TaxID=91739 RepID=UPI001C208FFE|nr:uncharacterized protein LOC121739996 [Aricia agestis]